MWKHLEGTIAIPAISPEKIYKTEAQLRDEVKLCQVVTVTFGASKLEYLRIGNKLMVDDGKPVEYAIFEIWITHPYYKVR